MKKNILITAAIIVATNLAFGQGTAINANGIAADSSAILDVSSTTQGTLITRMTSAQRNSIINPANGLLIYNLDCPGFNYYKGNMWYPFAFIPTLQTPGSITGNDSVCQNATGVSYSISAVSGATNYYWTVPPGAAVASGQGSVSVTIDFDTASGNIFVVALNDCELSNFSGLYVTTLLNPDTPVATAATNKQPVQFTANWNAAAGATSYFIDVSTDISFSSFIYNNVDAGLVLSYDVTGLTCNTQYYYRVRAYSSCGTSPNSNTITVTPSSCIPVISCGTQSFMASNLDAGTMVTSDAFHPSQQQFDNGITEKFCYNNDPANCTLYGGLYEWGEAMDYETAVNCDPCGPTTGHGGVQGICPAGFHIPSDLELSRLEYCLENNMSPTGSTPLSDFQTLYNYRGSNIPGTGTGDKMKSSPGDTPAWNSTNPSGFKATPAGQRMEYNGSFHDLSSHNYLWSATQNYHFLYSGDNRSNRQGPGGVYDGYSVRCLQD